MTGFTLGPDVSRWGEYGIVEQKWMWDGQPTKWKTIIHKNKPVVMGATDAYHVLPNEEAVKLADVAAEASGLVPFDKFTGAWFSRMNSHVILDGWKMHALYARNETFTIGGDKMHLGVGIHNAIDGSSAFGAGIFTFRTACANMVLAGSRGYEQTFDQRKTIEYVYQKHTKAIEPVIGQLQYTIQSVMDRAVGIEEAYRQMADAKATAARLDKIAQDLKRSKIPIKLTPDYLKIDEKGVRDIGVKPDTIWQVYNDLTENVWHADKGTMTRRIGLFDSIHKAIPLKPMVAKVV